jgi:hypothetical protein
MNDLDLLKRIPDRVEPLNNEAKDRIRALLDAQIAEPSKASTRTRAQRRKVRIAVIAVAAVLGGTAASVITNNVWTTDQPVAIPLDSGDHRNSIYLDISDPKGLVDPASLPRTVAEFAPAIRLPQGGSYEEWVDYATSSYRPEYAYETTRSTVAFKMVSIAQCQWVQQWLTATDTSHDAEATEAIRVLPGINTWLRGAGLFDDGYYDTLVDHMRQGDVAPVQYFENGCPFTGSWGNTVSERDAKATGDLAPAIQVVRSWLDGGGEPTDFTWHSGDSLAHLVEWTDPTTQPGPIFPGQIYIAPTTEAGVMLISPSESGTRFCAVISDSGVEHGIVDPERYPPDPSSINTPWDKYPGPVGCSPGAWPAEDVT